MIKQEITFKFKNWWNAKRSILWKSTITFLALFAMMITIIIIDQITKKYAITTKEQNFPIIEGVLGFSYVTNSGIFFGFFSRTGEKNPGIIYAFIIFSLMIYGIFFIFSKSKINRLSFCLILAGGISNFIDRLCRGYVVDFLYFIFFKNTSLSSIFNLADVAAVLGVIILTINFFMEFFLNYREEKKAEFLENQEKQKIRMAHNDDK